MNSDILLLSYMIALKRELTNIPFFFDIYNSSNLIVQDDLNMNMNIDISRDRSTSLSSNNFRDLLIYSNLSSILYHKRMEDISNKLSWDKQVAFNEKKDFILLYAISKIGKNKLTNKTTDHNSKEREQCSNIEVTILNNTPIPQDEDMANNNMNHKTLKHLLFYIRITN